MEKCYSYFYVLIRSIPNPIATKIKPTKEGYASLKRKKTITKQTKNP
jgi:hypothetical protein